MKTEEIVRLVQRADKVQKTSRAALLVEYSDCGELQVSTYGNPVCVDFLKKSLRKLLNDE